MHTDNANTRSGLDIALPCEGTRMGVQLPGSGKEVAVGKKGH